MNGQQSALPDLIVWLQALSVPCLGALAAWIAFQQWRTAERKVQLDLFDRRFAIYDAARQALHPIIRSGGAKVGDILEFRNATDKAFLLFGPEVVREIEDVAKAIGKLSASTAYMEDGPPYKPEHIEGRHESLLRVSEFFDKMPVLIQPYMSLAHKAPASPIKIRIPKALRPRRND